MKKEVMYCVDVIALKKKMVDCRLEKNVELAEASGVDRNTIANILSLGTRPSTVVMEKLMKALKMTPEEAGKIFFSQNLRNS